MPSLIRLIVVVALLVVAGSIWPAPSRTVDTARISPAAHAKKQASARAVAVRIGKKIDLERRATWSWQHVISLRTPTSYCEKHAHGLGYLRWCLHLWAKRHSRWQYYVQNPPHLRAWLCIHHYEGGWRDDTGNGYYGGLQMDLEFQRTYGESLLREKGTADHWTPLEQIWVAERAYESGRGFYPWPNTAKFCGLI